MGFLTLRFVPREKFLYTMIVPGEGFASFESCPGGLSWGWGMVLDKIDSCIKSMFSTGKYFQNQSCVFIGDFI